MLAKAKALVWEALLVKAKVLEWVFLLGSTQNKMKGTCVMRH